MAKKSSTIYLEQMFWNMITDYQKINGLSSRNDALQLILQEWDILRKIDFNNIKINVATENNVNTKSREIIIENKEIVEPEEKKEIDPRIANGLLRIANSMKMEE